MKERLPLLSLRTFLAILAIFLSSVAWAQSPAPPPEISSAQAERDVPADHTKSPATPKVCVACIRAEMNFLASDALRGRGSGTPDELLAATYVAAQLEQYGVAPAGDDRTYIQRATVVRQTLSAPLQLHFMTPGDGIPAQTIVWTHGKEMLALRLSQTDFRGPLKRVDAEQLLAGTDATPRTGAHAPDNADKPLAGKFVLLAGKDRKTIQSAANEAIEAGAVAVIVPASPAVLDSWAERGKQLPKLPAKVEGDGAGLELSNLNMFALNPEALNSLKEIPDGTMFWLEASVGPPEKSHTWNAVGKIEGRDPAMRKDVILLTAHLDHLGVGAPVSGDSIYNGADDDASGTVAVLELARVLAKGPGPKRTVIFALFGSEEEGGLGSTWFEAHPPVPISRIVANLEFEMIGRPDPKYPPDTLWLSGWERTNLGPTLAEHGAKLVEDERPEEHFFERSDNYVLARKGVVSQTASSFGLHNDYHQPSDDLAHINFKHMTAVIGSLIGPIEWLVNSSFTPEWKAGRRP
jgi:aminopeptidase YwaD